MKLKAKIFPKHLDEILNGKKNMEYREIESIVLTDGKRTVEFPIRRILNPDISMGDYIMGHYNDVKWKGKPMIAIELDTEKKEILKDV